jgi:hypothetical protein
MAWQARRGHVGEVPGSKGGMKDMDLTEKPVIAPRPIRRIGRFPMSYNRNDLFFTIMSLTKLRSCSIKYRIDAEKGLEINQV